MGQRLPSRRLVDQLQRRTVSAAYSDTATISRLIVTGSDDYGQPTGTTATSQIACSFTDKPSLEMWKDYADIEQIVAEIRVSSENVPNKGETVTLEGRWDTLEYVDQQFEIVDIRNRDEFGYVCALKKVQI